MKIAAFPKCYLDDIAGTGTMTVFDWIALARDLPGRWLGDVRGFLPPPR